MMRFWLRWLFVPDIVLGGDLQREPCHTIREGQHHILH